MTDKKIAIGDTLKTARENRGFSASTVGKMLDPAVTATAIYKWEQDKTEPSINHLKQLSDVLGINLGEVFGYDSDTERVGAYMSQMSDRQRTAVVDVARAMVEC